MAELGVQMGSTKEDKSGREESELLIMLQKGEGSFQAQRGSGEIVLVYTVYLHLETWAGLERVY